MVQNTGGLGILLVLRRVLRSYACQVCQSTTAIARAIDTGAPYVALGVLSCQEQVGPFGHLHGDAAIGFHPGIRPPLDVPLETPPEGLEHRRPARQHNVLTMGASMSGWMPRIHKEQRKAESAKRRAQSGGGGSEGRR